MTQKFKFSEGERVLCFHGPLIYEAKALKSTVSKDKQIKYYIHYAGWNKNWDEWVPEDRVLKYNEVNVQRQQEVFKEHSSSSSNKSKKASSKGKKGEGPSAKDGGTSSGGSESRASTPSKEIVALAAPSRSRSKQAANTSLNTSISKDVSSSGGTSSTGTNSKDVESKKDETKDNTTAAVKEDKDDVQKKKRGSSVSSNEKISEKVAEKPSNISTSSSSTNANVCTSAASTPTPTPTSERRLEDFNNGNGNGNSTLESVGTFLSKQEVKIKIPDELKQCLADDWDAVTRQHKLIEVPAKITVQDIIDQYVAYKKSTKSTNTSKEVKIVDVMNGIVEYFNVMLGSQLLYKYERPRYAEVLQQFSDTPPSKLYGAFHLLRLFIKLGSMLGYSGMDANKLTILVTSLQDFLKFLVKNSSTYFTMACFVNATPEYHRNMQ